MHFELIDVVLYKYMSGNGNIRELVENDNGHEERTIVGVLLLWTLFLLKALLEHVKIKAMLFPHNNKSIPKVNEQVQDELMDLVSSLCC